jgi:hypothetical protein
VTAEATTTATGAMPGAGAMPAQATSAAGTPPPMGATPPAGTTAPAAATPPATGDDAALGETGKRILADARRAAKEAEDRARAAEAERDALRTATQSEAEKATAAAVKEAEKAITATYEARIRRSELKSALTAAGIAPTELDLALMAPDFARLKVTEDGVDGLSDAVTLFAKGHPMLFAKQATPPVGDTGGGVRGRTTGGLTLDQIKAMSTEEIASRIDEVREAMSRQG